MAAMKNKREKEPSVWVLEYETARGRELSVDYPQARWTRDSAESYRDSLPEVKRQNYFVTEYRRVPSRAAWKGKSRGCYEE